MFKFGRFIGASTAVLAAALLPPTARADIDLFVSDVRVVSLAGDAAQIRISLGLDFGDVSPEYLASVAILDDAGNLRAYLIPNIIPMPCDSCPTGCQASTGAGTGNGRCYGVIDPPDGRPCHCFVLFTPVGDEFVTKDDGDEGRTWRVVVDWDSQISEVNEDNNVTEFTLAVPCPGDVDGNNLVDLTDIAITLANFGSTQATLGDGDVTGDNLVDLGDLSVVLGAFGSGC